MAEEQTQGQVLRKSWLLSPEPEEEPHTLEAHSVPRIVESVGLQLSWPEAILASMALSEEERRAIQVATTGQPNNPNWHLFRRGRLTASKFGAVLRSKHVLLQEVKPSC